MLNLTSMFTEFRRERPTAPSGKAVLPLPSLDLHLYRHLSHHLSTPVTLAAAGNASPASLVLIHLRARAVFIIVKIPNIHNCMFIDDAQDLGPDAIT